MKGNMSTTAYNFSTNIEAFFDTLLDHYTDGSINVNFHQRRDESFDKWLM